MPSSAAGVPRRRCHCASLFLFSTLFAQAQALRRSTAAQLIDAQEAIAAAMSGMGSMVGALEAKAGLAVAAQAVRIADLAQEVGGLEKFGGAWWQGWERWSALLKLRPAWR